MAALYQKYLADGPLFLLYSIHDGMENPQEAVEMLDQHVGQFAAESRVTERCGIREGFEIVGNRDRISSEGDGD